MLDPINHTGWFTEALHGPSNEVWEYDAEVGKIVVMIYHPVNTPLVLRNELRFYLKIMERFAHGTMAVSDIIELVETGRFTLITVAMNGRVVACGCFEFLVYPKYEALRVCLVAGDRKVKSETWAFQARDAVYSYMRDRGINYLEMFARPGAAKKLSEKYHFTRINERVSININEVK